MKLRKIRMFLNRTSRGVLRLSFFTFCESSSIDLVKFSEMTDKNAKMSPTVTKSDPTSFRFPVSTKISNTQCFL